MVARSLATPAFGQADLSNCEREPIHLAGSIQPHGALLVVREPDLVVVQASANAADFLGLGAPVLNRSLAAIAPELAARLAPLLREPLATLAVPIRCALGWAGAPCDGLAHRPARGGVVIELERAGPPIDLSRYVGQALKTIVGAFSLRGLAVEAARLARELTGYDRVMVYRFDDEGHGEVLAEQARADLEPYLGNRYPASDIPQIARRLYERNRVRVLVDVNFEPVPLEPLVSPITGSQLDMSLCVLRSSSPLHVQYLKNMGVSATMVASLMVGGKLWGLLSCHHYTPREAHFEIRAVCELLAEAVATRIAALESFLQAQAELSVRRLEQRMIEAISREGDWRGALVDNAQALLLPVGATGAALLFEGQILTAGDVPGTRQLRALGEWLVSRDEQRVIATSALTQDAPHLAHLVPVAAGILATRISTAPGEFLIWFRPEQVRTVTWGGDPFKPVVVGDDPSQLSPRRSFAQWHQLVEGTSEAWTSTDLTAARMIGDTVTDVIVQFRSVRMLIAEDQLAQVRRQVHLAGQPVIVADAEGRILLANETFQQLLPTNAAPLAVLDDLLVHLVEPGEARRRLRDVVRYQRTWRGEVAVLGGNGEHIALLVRADPVFSAPQRVLGFVLLFTDLTERKLADAARRRFQEGIIASYQPSRGPLGSNADLVYRTLLSSVVENAQLAALEITEGGEVASMPQTLESVRASVGRTAELLRNVVAHSADGLKESR